MLAMLRQINMTLRHLSKVDRREKLGEVTISEERSSAVNNSH
jgi:hypothetical protein